MKKATSTLLVGMLATTAIHLHAQTTWTQSGNNIFNTNSGYVGLSQRYILQNANVAGNAYMRGILAQGIYWDNANNRWQVGMAGDPNTDFGMLRFTNGGPLNFYTNTFGGSGAYTLSDVQLDKYRRFSILDNGVNVNGDINFNTATNLFRRIQGNVDNGGLVITGNMNVQTGSTINLFSNNTTQQGGVEVVAGDGNGSAAGGDRIFKVMKYGGGSYPTYLTVFRDGKVTMGDVTLRPEGYRLYVRDGIMAEKVRVAIHGSSYWSDFVFADDYELKPLHEVETYIKANRHLPEIPSAKEVVKEGIDVGEMNARLLQKVEELTLYVIQQQKEIDALKKQPKN